MSNNFIENVKNVLNEEYNVSITENGAIGYRTTGKELLDLNFSISSLRKKSDSDIQQRFEKAYLEDKLLAVKWLFYAADIRGGIGERRLFRVIMNYLAINDTEVARAVLKLIPEYTRWDNIIPLLDTPLKDDVISLIMNQLNDDMHNSSLNRPISLLAKWLPSSNASSKTTKRYAKIITSKLNLTDRQYRKMLSKLRAYLKVVEVSMSAKEWDKIDYSSVPSRANLLYKDAFLRNDEERRKEYLDSLVKGETKINAGTLFPHDIVHKYFNDSPWHFSYKVDSTIEELWKSLPDFVNGSGNTICVSDGSGSMRCSAGKKSSVSCLEVAMSLAIYFAERSSGQFKDKYITFSRNPQLVDLSKGKTLNEKIRIAKGYHEVADTNIEAVFDLILDTAIKFNMSHEELPKNILILSDMEFNECAVSNRGYQGSLDQKLFNVISKKYENAGYKLPRLVFWNISSRTGTIPIKENDLGVALVSGFSPSIVKMVLSNSTDPYECLLEQINSKRYDAVQEAIEDVI